MACCVVIAFVFAVLAKPLARTRFLRRRLARHDAAVAWTRGR
jgi:hypothetical protein